MKNYWIAALILLSTLGTSAQPQGGERYYELNCFPTAEQERFAFSEFFLHNNIYSSIFFVPHEDMTHEQLASKIMFPQGPIDLFEFKDGVLSVEWLEVYSLRITEQYAYYFTGTLQAPNQKVAIECNDFTIENMTEPAVKVKK